MELLVISINADPLLSFGTLHGGGQSKYVLELGKNLVGLGWSIDVLTLRNRGAPPVARVTEDFMVHRISRLGERDYDYDIDLAEIEALSRKHPAALDLSRYSLVLSCYWLSGVYLLHLDPDHRLPRVLTLCSLGHFKQSVDRSESIQERIETERRLAGRFDFVIATNSAERQALENVYRVDPSKIQMIPRGVNVELFGHFQEIPFYR